MSTAEEDEVSICCPACAAQGIETSPLEGKGRGLFEPHGRAQYRPPDAKVHCLQCPSQAVLDSLIQEGALVPGVSGGTGDLAENLPRQMP